MPGFKFRHPQSQGISIFDKYDFVKMGKYEDMD